MGDIQQRLVDVARQFPRVPLFIYGHSLGGALALNYLLTRKPDLCGAVVTSPGLAPGAPVGASKLAFARLLSHLAPSFTMDNGLDTNNLSHDLDVVQRYITDPLNTPYISASLAMQLIDRGQWMLTQKELPVPTLLMQGTKDHLVNLSATRQFAQNISPNHLTYKEWDGGFHELHNEPFKQEVLYFIRGWLDQRLVVASA
jgi:alpha-beta hydrolase superfamily lysophospholipase